MTKQHEDLYFVSGYLCPEYVNFAKTQATRFEPPTFGGKMDVVITHAHDSRGFHSTLGGPFGPTVISKTCFRNF